MTEACPGLELEPGDHSVLRQLSVAAKNHQRLVNPQKLAGGPQRLGIDRALWKDTIEYLRDMGFVEMLDGKVYIDIRCTCESGAEAPEWLRKTLQEQRRRPRERDPWTVPKPPRSKRVKRDPETAGPAGPGHYPSGGGVTEDAPTVADSRELSRRPTAVKRKGFAQRRMPTASAVSEPRAKTATNLRDLRLALKIKFREAHVADVLDMTIPHVIDNDEGGGFIVALKRMREDQHYAPDVILAMMDEFVKLVLARAIPIKGKVVWQVFVARRAQLFERVDRERKFGSSEDKLLPDAEYDRRTREVLDSARRRRLDTRSPRRSER